MKLTCASRPGSLARRTTSRGHNFMPSALPSQVCRGIAGFFSPIVDEIGWDEKAGLRTGCGARSQVIDVLEAQIKGDRQRRRLAPHLVSIVHSATDVTRRLTPFDRCSMRVTAIFRRQ